MNYFFAIAVIFSFTLFYVKVFHRQFAEMVSTATCSVALLLYLLTFAIPLNVSAIIVSGVGFAGLIYAAAREVQYVKAEGFHAKRYLCIQPALFALCCLVIFVTTKGRLASGWDEFSHWMLVSKNMYLFKDFGIGAYATTHFRGYPPITGLFNCFFTILNPVFREDYIYMGMAVSIVSFLFLPLRNAGKSFWNALFVFVVSLLSPFLVSGTIYHNLYVDGILGVSFAALLYVYFSDDGSSVVKSFHMALLGSHLVLTKASGMGLFIFAISIFIMDFILFGRDRIIGTSKKEKFYLVFLLGGAPLIPIFIKSSWSAYIGSLGISQAWNTSGITAAGLLELLSSARPDYRTVTIKRFIEAFFELRPFFEMEIRFSYFTFPIALSLVWLYIAKISGKPKRCLYQWGALSVTYYLYAVGLLILYLFTYSEYEAQHLASFDRYMDTIVLGLLLFSVFVLLESGILEKNREKPGTEGYLRLGCIVTVVLVLCNTGVSAMNNFLLFKPAKTAAWEMRHEYHVPSAFTDTLDYKMDKIYYVSQGGQGFDFQIAKFNLTPVPVNPDGMWSIANTPKDGDLWTEKLTAEEWERRLIENQYTYVYLYKHDDLFRDEFGSLFESSDVIKNRTIYRIAVEGDSVTLIPCFDIDS